MAAKDVTKKKKRRWTRDDTEPVSYTHLLCVVSAGAAGEPGVVPV